MVYGCTSRKYYGCKFSDIHFLLTKFLGRKTLDLDKRTEYQLYVVLLSYVEVRRLFGRWLGL